MRRHEAINRAGSICNNHIPFNLIGADGGKLKPEAYRRMKVVGRLFVLIGFGVPAILIVLLVLRLGELVVVGALECGVLAVGFIGAGAVLWAGGWILEGNAS